MSRWGDSEYSQESIDLYAEFLRRVEEAGGGRPELDDWFDAFCDEYPDSRDELEGLHTEWSNVAGVLDRLHETDEPVVQAVSPPAAAEPATAVEWNPTADDFSLGEPAAAHDAAADSPGLLAGLPPWAVPSAVALLLVVVGLGWSSVSHARESEHWRGQHEAALERESSARDAELAERQAREVAERVSSEERARAAEAQRQRAEALRQREEAERQRGEAEQERLAALRARDQANSAREEALARAAESDSARSEAIAAEQAAQAARDNAQAAERQERRLRQAAESAAELAAAERESEARAKLAAEERLRAALEAELAAREARERAQASLELAEAARVAARQKSYEALVRVALADLVTGDTEAARRELLECPTELRGFEWSLLRGAAEREQAPEPTLQESIAPALQLLLPVPFGQAESPPVWAPHRAGWTSRRGALVFTADGGVEVAGEPASDVDLPAELIEAGCTSPCVPVPGGTRWIAADATGCLGIWHADGRQLLALPPCVLEVALETSASGDTRLATLTSEGWIEVWEFTHPVEQGASVRPTSQDGAAGSDE